MRSPGLICPPARGRDWRAAARLILAAGLCWTTIETPARAEGEAAAAQPGATRIDAVRFSGAVSLADETLQGAVRPWLGRELSVPQMREMAGAVTALYRKHGYLVARAYVPAQTLSQTPSGATLSLTVIEGRYSQVRLKSNASAVPDGQILRTYQANLCGRAAGCQGLGPIRGQDLERAGLVTSEIAGVRPSYELAPGEEPGSTSILIKVAGAHRLSGTVDVDNEGLASTGRKRAAVALSAANLLHRGDVTTFSGAYSGKGFLSFALDTSLPVGAGGARAGFTAGRTHYALGREFAILDASGASTAVGLYASYPLLRSLTGSADVRLDVVGKRIENDVKTLGLAGRQQAGEAVLSVAGVQSDTLLQAGSTRYRLSATAGRLNIRDAASRAFDAATARTDGGFGKLGYAFSREEVLRPGWTVFAALSGQYGLNNLDPSEKFALSGPSGVRAYVTGAVTADTATLAVLETRLRMSAPWLRRHQLVLAPFYEHGWAQFNKQAWAGYVGPRHADLGGLGLYAWLTLPGRYSLRATYARRDGATPAGLAPAARDQVWVEAAAAF